MIKTPNNKRFIKVEEVGDYRYKKTYPRIRLKGLWLKQCGIQPNSYIEVSNPQPGLILIRHMVSLKEVNNKNSL